MLQAELDRHDSAEGRRWARALAPLAEAFADRFARLPAAGRLSDPGRDALQHRLRRCALALDYAERRRRRARWPSCCRSRALTWYAADRDCQAWEPSQDDFLSPALMEAECMRRVLPPDAFADVVRGLPAARWPSGEPATLFEPGHASATAPTARSPTSTA